MRRQQVLAPVIGGGGMQHDLGLRRPDLDQLAGANPQGGHRVEVGLESIDRQLPNAERNVCAKIDCMTSAAKSSDLHADIPAPAEPLSNPSVPEGSAGPGEQAVSNDYDSFAEAYAAVNETSLHNAYYERPAMLDLAGDVTGRRVLDAGCGSGPLSAALRDRGATVTGFDSSAEMLELARKRLGGDAALYLAELGGPLPFPDGAFDVVVASLVLHYMEDWTVALAELRRVLAPGGRLIVSVDHPVIGLVQGNGDYFATYKRSEEWTFGGHTALMSFWHRPLHAMTNAFTAAGFQINVISEPFPAPEAHELFPDAFVDKPSGAFVSFLFFVLQAD